MKKSACRMITALSAAALLMTAPVSSVFAEETDNSQDLDAIMMEVAANAGDAEDVQKAAADAYTASVESGNSTEISSIIANQTIVNLAFLEADTDEERETALKAANILTAEAADSIPGASDESSSEETSSDDTTAENTAEESAPEEETTSSEEAVSEDEAAAEVTETVASVEAAASTETSTEDSEDTQSAADAVEDTADAAREAAQQAAQSAAATASDTDKSDAATKTTSSSTSVSESDRKLLAAIIYCEAGNQSMKGKIAVGNVVLNRVKSKKFPNTISKVIYQSGQFSPAGSGWLNRVLRTGNIPSSCYEAADRALAGERPVGNCIFFMRTYLHSSGIIIGAHCFWGSM